MLNSLVKLAHALLNKNLFNEVSQVISVIARAINPWSAIGAEALQICTTMETKLGYLKTVPNAEGDLRQAVKTIEDRLEKLQEWWIDSLSTEIKNGSKHVQEFLDRFIRPLITKDMPTLKEAMGRAKRGGEYNLLLADVQSLAALSVKLPSSPVIPAWKPTEPPQKLRVRPRFNVPMQATPGYPIPGDPNINIYRNPQSAELLPVKLIALANELDRRGHYTEADAIDSVLCCISYDIQMN